MDAGRFGGNINTEGLTSFVRAGELTAQQVLVPGIFLRRRFFWWRLPS
jgi:hypothetical protein